jgi:hypothetical protein
MKKKIFLSFSDALKSLSIYRSSLQKILPYRKKINSFFCSEMEENSKSVAASATTATTKKKKKKKKMEGGGNGNKRSFLCERELVVLATQHVATDCVFFF